MLMLRMNGIIRMESKTLELYGNFPLSVLKAGERVLVYCRKCKRELELDQVIDHMMVNDQNPDGHSLHFTIEKG
jgi:uncharacterized alpha-E superfamily protein